MEMVLKLLQVQHDYDQVEGPELALSGRKSLVRFSAESGRSEGQGNFRT